MKGEPVRDIETLRMNVQMREWSLESLWNINMTDCNALADLFCYINALVEDEEDLTMSAAFDRVAAECGTTDTKIDIAGEPSSVLEILYFTGGRVYEARFRERLTPKGRRRLDQTRAMLMDAIDNVIDREEDEDDE